MPMCKKNRQKISRSRMQQVRTFITPEGKKVIATVYRANVAWHTVGKAWSKGVDSIKNFERKIGYNNWKEIKNESVETK